MINFLNSEVRHFKECIVFNLTSTFVYFKITDLYFIPSDIQFFLFRAMFINMYKKIKLIKASWKIWWRLTSDVSEGKVMLQWLQYAVMLLIQLPFADRRLVCEADSSYITRDILDEHFSPKVDCLRCWALSSEIRTWWIRCLLRACVRACVRVSACACVCAVSAYIYIACTPKNLYYMLT